MGVTSLIEGKSCFFRSFCCCVTVFVSARICQFVFLFMVRSKSASGDFSIVVKKLHPYLLVKAALTTCRFDDLLFWCPTSVICRISSCEEPDQLNDCYC